MNSEPVTLIADGFVQGTKPVSFSCRDRGFPDGRRLLEKIQFQGLVAVSHLLQDQEGL